VKSFGTGHDRRSGASDIELCYKPPDFPRDRRHFSVPKQIDATRRQVADLLSVLADALGKFLEVDEIGASRSHPVEAPGRQRRVKPLQENVVVYAGGHCLRVAVAQEPDPVQHAPRSLVKAQARPGEGLFSLETLEVVLKPRDQILHAASLDDQLASDHLSRRLRALGTICRPRNW